MSKIFAVAGKGGVGKTTISSLLILSLSKRGNVVLAVDADPNTNLEEKLGVDLEGTIGGVREDISKNIDNLPGGISKPEYIKMKIQESISEGDSYDLLSMGRQEGPGCYCYINQLLRTTVDNMADKYRYVIIDNEAGMEHLSRRTCKDIDILFIIADPTVTGVRTGTRIKKLAQEMEINVGKFILIINRSKDPVDHLNKQIEEAGFDGVEIVPDDPEIRKATERGDPLTTVPENSPAKKKIENIVVKYK
jgi:CO dehydrogenase maturation factor